MPIKLAVHGAAGRMGQRVVACAAADQGFQIVAAHESVDHPQLGQDAGTIAGAGELGLQLSAVTDSDAEVVIDFSVPNASITIVEHCVKQGTPLVIATTGFSDQQINTIHQAAETIPVVFAPSMSPAVNLVMKLTEIAGGALKDLPTGVDVEIIERHHRFKEDAPSGTALKFGEIVANAMDKPDVTHGREGRPGQRSAGEIGYHAVRTGDNPGEHTIIFGMLGETIELNVAASNRDCYAQGALMAAKWVLNKPAGLYGMAEVLGF
ncbi:4-hydroxy-tetrahydrodipicolinate reductase [Adhaeretor mobilis]|uniref:4-hydroxy-tetrahydrodipicolinate reductase n=1 Tax=Adhaeretor mobilis TaxID=1930276 RepID=A0A517MYA7_9BACT|nr:4-hydroxy-tetrahydrodipicolinate reductase [Adhaeretor mobilis]QDS99858.1 4-hydroxy-tetrahydrodipicolinate reductase [Adhaeretor mobilis]